MATGDTDIEQDAGPSRGSLLRAALDNDHYAGSDQAVVDDNDLSSSTPPDVTSRIAEHRRLSVARESRDNSVFDRQPSLGSSPFAGSFGSDYGSLASRINEPAKKQAGRLFSEQQATGTSAPDKEREPLLAKKVSQPEGNDVEVIVGQSTLPQTIFNSVNVLIGVGMLSLPLAIKYSGWLIGMFFFLLSALGTRYTAKLLAKCLDVDQSLVTFADIAYVSYGHRARIGVSIIFTLELVGVCVALVILFADSMDLLITGWGTTAWKVVCGIVMVPLSFLPMRLLSFTSILGIICCILSKSITFGSVRLILILFSRRRSLRRRYHQAPCPGISA